jgi:two-component system, LytTR family, response regulator
MTAGSKPLGTVRTLVCEDEPLARRAIREYLKDVEWVEIVAEAANGNEAMRLLHKHEPDLVFMDVRMPGLTGIEVLDAATHRAAVVFTTAYDAYALTAFELGAVDYLVKPFGRERLLETLNRVRVRLVGEVAGEPRAGGITDRLFARHRGGMVPVSTSEILRVDAATSGCSLVTARGAFELDVTLGEVERRLDPDDFVRVHRSHILNLEHVDRIRRYDERRLEVRLSDGSTVVASRQGSKLLRTLMA